MIELVKRYGLKVDVIKEISKAMVDGKMPNIDNYKKQMSAGDDSSFIAKLEMFESDDLKKFIDKVTQFKEDSNNKYKDPIKILKNWVDNEKICDPKSNKLRGSFGGGDNNIGALLGSMNDIGFKMENFLEWTRRVRDNEADCGNGNGNGKGKDRERDRRADYYLDGKKAAQTEAKAMYTFLKYLMETKPLQMLKDWGKPVSGTSNEKTYGDCITYALSTSSTPITLPDVTKMLTMYDERLIKELAESAGTPATVSRIENIVKESIGAASNPVKGVREELEKALETVLQRAEDLMRKTALNDIVNAMSTLQSTMSTLSTTLGRFTRSTGTTAASSATSSLWVSSVMKGALVPLANIPTLSLGASEGAARMHMFTVQITQHLQRIQSEALDTDIAASAQNSNVLLNELVKDSKSSTCDPANIRVSIVQVLKTHVGNVKRILNRYKRKHTDFVLWTNRRPLEYMIKQAANKNNLTSDEKVQLDSYFNCMGQLGMSVNDVLMKAEGKALLIFTQGEHMNVVGQDEVQVERVQNLVDSLEKYMAEERSTLVRMYSPAGASPLDVFKEPTFAVVYAVKAVRMLLTWAALTFAKGIFVPLYNDAVYTKNNRPPSPLIFVFIYIGLDIGLNAMLFVILIALKYMFKTRDNAFFINDKVLSAVLVDYALSTLLIIIIAAVVGVVIQKKKYFRYRFEGDRGIRAMSDMLLWLVNGILLIPFFRFIEV
jgi:hypothetical protein